MAIILERSNEKLKYFVLHNSIKHCAKFGIYITIRIELHLVFEKSHLHTF